MPELTPAEATDERLWVTLSFSEYFEYSFKRWPDRGQAASPEQHTDNHWFAPNTRRRVRDNAIARLWWTRYHASKIADGGDVEAVLKKLLFNTDYRAQILDRASSSNCAILARVLLSLQDISALPNTENPADYSRIHWRPFMKFVNRTGGRRNLAAMSEDEVIRLFLPAYKEAYNIE